MKLAGNPKMPKAVPEPEKDWEDEYRRLLQQHNELKLVKNHLEDQIRM